MTTVTPTRTAGTAQALPLLFASCLSVLGAVLLAPIIPQLFGAFPGVPQGLVPLIISAPALMIAVFAPFAGQIADRVGRKNLLIGAMIVYAFVGTAPLWLPAEFSFILVSRLLVGVCEAAIMTCCTTMIGDYFAGDRRNRYFGLQSVFTTISATIFLLVGGVLGASGWRTPFLVYALSLIIVIPMFFVLWEPKKSPEAMAAPMAGAKSRIPWRTLALPLVVTLFGGFAFFVVLIEPPQVYATLGLTDSAAIGPISAVASIATAIVAFQFGRLARRGAKVLLPIALAAMAIGYVVVWVAANVGSLPGVIAGVLIASAGTGLLLPTLVGWSVGKIQFAERGRATGVWTSAFFLGQFLTPILMLVIQGALGVSVAGAVGVVGIACAVAAIALALAVRPGPIVATAEPAASVAAV
ncbi:MAG: MFS transporter [Pseudolysinimonas sp.]